MLHAVDAEALARPAFRVVLVRADGATAGTFSLSAQRTVVGRSEGTLLIPDDPYVAGAHCALLLTGGTLEIEDLQSGSGTWLKVPPGESIRLGSGSEIRLGHQRLVLEAMPAPDWQPGEPKVWGSPDPGYLVRLVQHLEGGGTGAIWPLTEGSVLLGREEGEIRFPSDGFVSGRHARLTVKADASVYFEDVGSSNGSYLRLRQRTKLSVGDLVLVGTHLLRIEAG
ncbi:MAG: FHA domain-containing protein [Deltaproteobacteria bacterium]|nr:MAG: FHA domain-containing protein [Deltaproteobacteria bacterium]